MTVIDDLHARAVAEVRAFISKDAVVAETTAPILVDRLFNLHTNIEAERRKEESAKQATPAAQWRERFKTRVRELSNGWSVEVRPLSLTGEILRGSLPNAALSHVIFDDTPETERDRDYHQKRYEGMLKLAARALVAPKLVLDHEPDYDKGEIGPDDLTMVELENVYWWSVREVVPPLESAPFHSLEGSPTGDVSGTGRPGAAVSHDTGGISRSESADG